MGITGKVLAVIVITVAVILAGAAVGVTALVKSSQSNEAPSNGPSQSQSINQKIIVPPGTPGSTTQQNGNSSSSSTSSNGSAPGPVAFVPVGPVIQEPDGTSQQSVRVTVNNTVIVTTKVTNTAGGWYVITGWNTYAGTIPPPWSAVQYWRANHLYLNRRRHRSGRGINVPFALPSVVGLTQQGAQNILSARRLIVVVQIVVQSGSVGGAAKQNIPVQTVAQRSPAGGAANGQVLREVPSAGTIVAPGDVVTIYVAGPPATTTQLPVPSVIGTNSAAAERILRSAGFTVVASTVPGPAGATPGNVFSQTPSGGTLPKGGTVTINVAAKPAATPTPTPTTPTPTPTTPTSPTSPSTPPTNPTSPTSPTSPSAPSGQQVSSGSQSTG